MQYIIEFIFQENVSDEYSEEDAGEIKKIIDKALAKFFYTCNISFTTVEKPYFRQFINTLVGYSRKDAKFVYKPPCRETLATTYLVEIHDGIQDMKKDILKNTNSVLQADGWTNSVTNKKLLVFTLTNYNTPLLFLSYVDVSLETEDGENLSQHFNEAIKMAKEVYETNVVAITTDNDSKILCGARLATNSDNLPLIQCSCNSHSANLLIKSIIDDEFLNIIREVVKAYRVPKIQTLLVERFKGTQLKNFPDTRFCYIRDSCETILKNLTKMRSITAITDCGIDPTICEIVNSSDFQADVTDIHRTLTPVCKLINKCQDPKANIADATQLWLQLKLPTDKYNELIRQRIVKAVWPVGYVANYIHPKYKGVLLNNEQLRKVKEFLKQHLNNEGRNELEQFIANRNTDPFLIKAQSCSTPISYWSLLKHKYKNLSILALKIMIIPASTARIEGLFSNWTYIHNSYRNRLGNLTSAQLLDTYHFLTTTTHQRVKKSKRKRLEI